MFDINQIYKIDNFLIENERKTFDFLCDQYNWKLSGFSYHPESRMFWSKDLWESTPTPCKEIEESFRIKLQDIFNIKLETIRLYLNGQAHGQCGSMHADITEEVIGGDYITLVYYVNLDWLPEYGGSTVIIDNQNNIHNCYPNPNSAVVFNSRLKHIGLEPTIHCKTQRVTLAQKMKIIKD